MIKVPKSNLEIKDFTNGHWIFPEKMDSQAYSGFIYVVRDNYFKQFYLGKKVYKGSRGKARGVESNWKRYMSSSKHLQIMFAERPKSEFDFIVLEQYKMKGAVSYAETWTLCNVEAPTKAEWLNVRIEPVSWSVSEAVTDRHKDRLKRVIALERF